MLIRALTVFISCLSLILSRMQPLEVEGHYLLTAKATSFLANESASPLLEVGKRKKKKESHGFSFLSRTDEADFVKILIKNFVNFIKEMGLQHALPNLFFFF